MRPPPKLESGPNAGIRANPVRLKKYLNCIVIPSVRGVARIPAFGPLSNFGGGRIYIVFKDVGGYTLDPFAINYSFVFKPT